jgi:hypothetical protein
LSTKLSGLLGYSLVLKGYFEMDPAGGLFMLFFTQLVYGLAQWIRFLAQKATPALLEVSEPCQTNSPNVL